MSTPGGEQIGQAHIEIDIDLSRAELALREFSREAQGSLREVRGRFATEGAQISRSLEGTSRDTDRFGLSLRGLGTTLGPLGGVLGKVALGVGGIGAAAGSALPLIASVVTALEQIGPAAAVGATALLAVQQATQTIKLGMIGVQDTVTAAFDSSAAGAEKFQKSLDKLAPSAQEFALTVKSLVPAFTDFQQSVQQELFLGLSNELTKLSGSVLPVLQTNLKTTATTLNDMALNAAQAAGVLATSGTLGQAMAGANTGLKNLSGVPALVVTGLGQLAAAASPAFDRITSAAAGAATSIADHLSKAFASGGLTDAINTAIDILSGLGDIAGNIFGTIGNVLGAAATGGDGFFAVLTSITQTLQDVSGTKGFQDAIGALVQTMGVFADTVGPLLGQAIAVLGPVLTTLAVPVQTLIKALGDGLSPIIAALGPVLEGAAQAVGAIVLAFSPLLPIIGDLIAALLPALTPILDTITQLFTDLAPVIFQVGNTFAAILAPILANLPTLIFPLLAMFTQLTQTLLPVLSDLMAQLAPVFLQFLDAISQNQAQLIGLVTQVLPVLVDLFVQLLPSIVQIVSATIQLETAVLPVVGLLIQLASLVLPLLANEFTFIAQAISAVVSIVAGGITNILIPVIDTLVALFSGDFSGALASFRDLLSGLWTQLSTVLSAVGGLISKAIDTIVGVFQYLYDTLIGHSIIPDLVHGIMSLFTGLISFFVSNAGAIRATLVAAWNAIAGATSTAFNRVKDAATTAISAVVRTVSGLKGRVTDALGNVGSLLYNSGRSLIQGFISGIKSQLSAVGDTAKSIVQKARDFFGSSPAKVGPLSGKGWTLYSGQAFGGDFAAGIADRQGQVASAAGSLVSRAAAPVSTPRAGVSSLLTTARVSGTATTVTPQVNVAASAAPNVTVIMGNEVINDRVQILIDRNNAAQARLVAQGVRG